MNSGPWGVYIKMSVNQLAIAHKDTRRFSEKKFLLKEGWEMSKNCFIKQRSLKGGCISVVKKSNRVSP